MTHKKCILEITVTQFNMCFLSIVIDICLYLRKDTSEVDSYNCLNFAHGCPTGTYRGSTVYKSKVAYPAYPSFYFFYIIIVFCFKDEQMINKSRFTKQIKLFPLTLKIIFVFVFFLQIQVAFLLEMDAFLLKSLVKGQ